MFVRASHVTYKSWGQTRARDAKSCERALSTFLVHSRRSTLERSRRFSCTLDSHALSKSLNTPPLSFSFGLKLSRTLINSRALSKSLNSPPLSFSFGLKLSRTFINSRALSRSLNSRPLSLSFGLKLSCTLINCRALSKSLNSPPLSLFYGLDLRIRAH